MSISPSLASQSFLRARVTVKTGWGPVAELTARVQCTRSAKQDRHLRISTRQSTRIPEQRLRKKDILRQDSHTSRYQDALGRVGLVLLDRNRHDTRKELVDTQTVGVVGVLDASLTTLIYTSARHTKTVSGRLPESKRDSPSSTVEATSPNLFSSSNNRPWASFALSFEEVAL